MDALQDAQPTQRMFSGSADFFMYQFKIVPCTLPHSHDWSSCPYVHRNEKARRRNPKHFSYAAIPCPVDRKGTNCPRGDACPYSHNVYEYWLHPDRFRTQMCRDGNQCNRPLCFFAHERCELRQPPLRPPADGMLDQQQPQQHEGMGMGPPGISMPNGFLEQFQQLGVQQQPMHHLQHQQQQLAVPGGPLAGMPQQVQYLPAQPGMMVPIMQASSGAMGVMPYPAPAAMSSGAAMGYASYTPAAAGGGAPAAWHMWDPNAAQQQQQQQQVAAAGYSATMLHQPWSQAQPVLAGQGGGGMKLAQQQQPQQQQGLLVANQQQHGSMLVPAPQQQQLQQGVPSYHLMQQRQQPVNMQQQQQQPPQQQQQQVVLVVSGPVEVGRQANLGGQQAAATASLALPINQHLASVGSPGAPSSSYGSPVGGAAASDGLLSSSSVQKLLSGVSPPGSWLQLQGSGGSGSYAGNSSLSLVQLPVCSGIELDQQQQQQQQYAYLTLPSEPTASANGNTQHPSISSSSGPLQGLQLVGSTGLMGSPGGPASSAAAGAAAAAISTADPRLLLGSWSDAAAANAGLLVTTAGFGY